MRPPFLLPAFILGCASSVGGTPPRDAAAPDAVLDAAPSLDRTPADDTLSLDPRCTAMPCLQHPILRSHGTGIWLVFPDGRTFHWGQSQFVGGPPDLAPTPGPRLPADLLDLQAGPRHSCALRASGGRVICWGQNTDGQLGNALPEAAREPVEVAGIRGVTALALAETSTWAVRDGALAYWGTPGALGNLPPTASPRPAFDLSNALAFSGSPVGDSLGVILRDGTALAWGRNDWGNLGDGTRQTRTAPVAIRDLRGVLSLHLSANASCAVAAAGPAGNGLCWGERHWLGNLVRQNPPEIFSTPAPLAGPQDLIQMVVGEYFACAVDGSLTVRCWGINLEGVLGAGSLELEGLSPNGPLVRLPAVREIALAGRAVCALTMDDVVYCWGDASRGVLAQGDDIDRPSPVRAYPARTR